MQITPPKKWECNCCSLGNLPFSKTNDNDFLINLLGLDDKNSDFLRNVPSFSIQSLINQIPGENFDTNEFLSESITSKYYTPAEFITAKLPKNKFSIIHLNIASLSAHIDELRSLLSLLDHPFDAICISETRFHEDTPLINYQIDDYDFFHEKTPTQCGGVAIYVKSTYNPVKISKFSGAHHQVSESVFVEIKSKSKRNF